MVKSYVFQILLKICYLIFLGEFGVVWKGYLETDDGKERMVAVKCLRVRWSFIFSLGMFTAFNRGCAVNRVVQQSGVSTLFWYPKQR